MPLATLLVGARWGSMCRSKGKLEQQAPQKNALLLIALRCGEVSSAQQDASLSLDAMPPAKHSPDASGDDPAPAQGNTARPTTAVEERRGRHHP